MNELYNKRQTNVHTLHGSNQPYYRDRQEYDTFMANQIKQKNDGKKGNVPWGTGYKPNKVQTSNQTLGSFYQVPVQQRYNSSNNSRGIF